MFLLPTHQKLILSALKNETFMGVLTIGLYLYTIKSTTVV